MKCHVCGGQMKSLVTDLPFKVTDTAIIILKNLPVIQCESCKEYLLEDEVMQCVDEILSKTNKTAELEVIRYAA